MPDLKVECELDPNQQGRAALRVLARTPEDVQREVTSIMDSPDYRHVSFTFPVRITFADDKYFGWWCSLGEAQA